MIISDLNYLETTEGNAVIGGDFDFDISKDIEVNIDIFETVDIDKDVSSVVYVEGNLATAESSANAFGNNTLTETFSLTYTDWNQSHSNSLAISATY
ncbi:MAG: hypothetical protein WBA07_03800 [Rivularia sp. (in: cyanobacteria)]